MAFKSIYTSLYLQGSLAPTVELWYWWTSTRGFGGGFFFKFVHFEVEKIKKNQIKSAKKFIKKQIKIYYIERSVQKFIFLKLLLCGDVETNPGPISIETYRSRIGNFQGVAKRMTESNVLCNFLNLTSGTFYTWKKENLSCPNTSSSPRFHSKMARIKSMNAAFLASITKKSTKCSVFFSLVNNQISINVLSSSCTSQKVTKFISTYEEDDYNWCSHENVTKISKKKKRQSNIKKRIGFQITNKDFLFLRNPISFQSNFPSVSFPFPTSQNSFDRSLLLLLAGDVESNPGPPKNSTEKKVGRPKTPKKVVGRKKNTK